MGCKFFLGNYLVILQLLFSSIIIHIKETANAGQSKDYKNLRGCTHCQSGIGRLWRWNKWVHLVQLAVDSSENWRGRQRICIWLHDWANSTAGDVATATDR